jgi:UDP-N-acetylmuramoylalanine--D-glutamate ligase
MVAVTGSLGKSTVVSLLEAAAASAGIDAFVGGNLGIPLGEYIADVKEGIRSQRANWVVLELSSFQLENCGGLAPEYSAITYLAPNHLERYPSLDAYYACKWELVKRTKSKVFLNSNGGDLKQYAQKFPSEKVVWTESAAAHFRAARLLGKHNQDNIMLAATIASTCGWGEATKKGLLEFRGLPHRMQNLGTHGGALFINDSKATTIESVQSALEGALESHAGDIFLLLGGKDKNLPWGKLKFLKELPRVRPVFFGASAEVIQSQSGVSGPSFASLRDLVSGLPKLVKAGDMVLLSPGGTSHDEFHNFEERGRSFSRWVEEVFSK